MRVTKMALMSVVCAGFAGFGSAQAEPEPVAPGPAAAPLTPRADPESPATDDEWRERKRDRRRERKRGRCPKVPEGTTIQAADTEDGAALDFTTETEEDVDALRERVAHMADRHNRRHAKDEDGNDRDGRRRMRRHRRMVPSDAHTEDIGGGARLSFTPQDPEDLETLREQVQRMADRMSECPRMSTPDE